MRSEGRESVGCVWVRRGAGRALAPTTSARGVYGMQPLHAPHRAGKLLTSDTLSFPTRHRYASTGPARERLRVPRASHYPQPPTFHVNVNTHRSASCPIAARPFSISGRCTLHHSRTVE